MIVALIKWIFIGFAALLLLALLIPNNPAVLESLSIAVLSLSFFLFFRDVKSIRKKRAEEKAFKEAEEIANKSSEDPERIKKNPTLKEAWDKSFGSEEFKKDMKESKEKIKKGLDQMSEALERTGDALNQVAIAIDGLKKPFTFNNSSTSKVIPTSTSSETTSNSVPNNSISSSNSTDSGSASSPKDEWSAFGKAYAIQGAIVTSSSGSQMSYIRKCEACGYANNSEKWETSAPIKGSMLDTSFSCTKCGNNQKLQIGTS